MKEQSDLEVKDSKEKVDDEEKKDSECVFILKDGKVKLTVVKTGIQDNNYIEIISGLSVGQEVVSAPYSMIAKTLKDGDLVEKTAKDKLYSTEKK